MALELGANAVLGYRNNSVNYQKMHLKWRVWIVGQNFDVEGDTGIVVRAIGTAVKLVKEAIDVKE